MKTKDLISITLKIIGLIALWKCILALVPVIGGIGMMTTFFTGIGNMDNPFMFIMVMSLLLNFVFPFVVAILFLFRTQEVVSFLKIKEGQIDFNINRKPFYRLVVMVFGCIIILHGAGNFIEFNYNTNTTTQRTTNNTMVNPSVPGNSNNETISVTKSQSKDINYFALVEILLGIILLIKAVEVSKILERKLEFEPQESSDPVSS